MRLHRFLVQFDPESTSEIQDKNLVHQLKNVLKLGIGESLILFNESGVSVEVKILNYTKSGVEYEVLNYRKKSAEARRKVILACSVVKRDNFEWIAEKATEVGAVEIVPLLTDHSVKLGLQAKRLEKIIKEAVEQSGRFKVPKLSSITKFESALRLGDKNTLRILFDTRGEKLSSADLKDKDTVIIFVGPEGGWNESEKKLAEKYGCLVRSMQDQTMRTETAAIIGCYLACNL